MVAAEGRQVASPMRLLEVLSDRFGAFEALAGSTIKLARHAPEEEFAMEPSVAEALLQLVTICVRRPRRRWNGRVQEA